MASIKIANKNFMTQSGNDEPAITSNVTFPADHIIQLQYYRFTDSDSDSGGQWQDSPASITITPSYSSSFILVQLFAGFGINNNQSDTNISYRLYNNTQSTVIFEGQTNTPVANGYAYSMLGSTFCGLDISPNSGANLYKFQYGKNGGNGPCSFNPYGKQCVMIAMEIKQ
tara:strand:+ start:1696 stop:2205 length:510 start_codon:yes stop_codon:yes gene_type:complete